MYDPFEILSDSDGSFLLPLYVWSWLQVIDRDTTFFVMIIYVGTYNLRRLHVSDNWTFPFDRPEAINSHFLPSTWYYYSTKNHAFEFSEVYCRRQKNAIFSL
jgi:hypothetical protein